MLIYARKDSTLQSSSTSSDTNVRPGDVVQVPTPPIRALESINALNNAHHLACESFTEQEKEAELLFSDRRRKIMDIYRNWNVTSYNEVCGYKVPDDSRCIE